MILKKLVHLRYIISDFELLRISDFQTKIISDFELFEISDYAIKKIADYPKMAEQAFFGKLKDTDR